MKPAKNTLGLYLQVPFCQTKCTYCNFHTGVVASARFEPYVDAVCREIRDHRELHRSAGVRLPEGFENAVVNTVFVGGGTPSLLDAPLLGRMIGAIRETFSLHEGPEGSSLAEFEMEVTLEADPETVTSEKASAWVAAGINRVSFGVQSFSEKELVASGRMQRREDIYRAVPQLRAAGIRNISFDLIAGLPFQTRESWQESLEELGRLAPEHVSIYLLEVDEGSRLGLEILQNGARYSAGAVPSDDEMAEFYETACGFLEKLGYHHYEISNWAKPGFESRHNLKYWKREAYLGFGAGAHSFSGRQRWANAHDAAAYVATIEAGRLPVEQLEAVTEESALEEELFLGLRQLDGINLERIERQYGVTLGSRFDPLVKAGLLERRGDVVKLAGGRLAVSNEVFVSLMR